MNVSVFIFYIRKVYKSLYFIGIVVMFFYKICEGVNSKVNRLMKCKYYIYWYIYMYIVWVYVMI